MNDVVTRRFVVDRLEGRFAVVEELGPLPLAIIPEGVAEGDVLELSRGAGEVRLKVDPRARAQAEDETKRLQSALPSLSLGGDDPLEL